MDKKKIGRNALCPCGSGKKYKRCHGAITSASASISLYPIPKNVPQQVFREIEALRRQREAQQGFGRPIISTMHKGYRFVAVGSKLYWSDKWKTFHDFLFDYIKFLTGSDWGNEELKKPLINRHPILQWYDVVCAYQRQTIRRPGEVVSAPMIGAVAAYKKHHSRVKDAIELFDFFYYTYSKTPKDRLLEFMKGARDIEHLAALSQEELAFTYCERLVNHALSEKDV